MGILDYLNQQVETIRQREVSLDGRSQSSPLFILEQDIIFAAEQLAHARAFRQKHLGEIYRAKFYTYREWKIVGPYGAEWRHKEIKDRLTDLDQQKRRMELEHERDITGLQRHLFGLLRQRAALS